MEIRPRIATTSGVAREREPEGLVLHPDAVMGAEELTSAMAASHRLLEALVARDVHGAGALFVPDACVWASRRGGLPSMQEPGVLARTLVELLDGTPPRRLSVIAHGARTALTSAYGARGLLWTLEVQVDAEHVIAAYLRGVSQA